MIKKLLIDPVFGAGIVKIAASLGLSSDLGTRATFLIIKPSYIERDSMEAYCVKCKAKKEMKDAKQVTMKNGRKATSGSCPTCGTKMFKIGG
jgi:hypothetical protein